MEHSDDERKIAWMKLRGFRWLCDNTRCFKTHPLDLLFRAVTKQIHKGFNVKLPHFSCPYEIQKTKISYDDDIEYSHRSRVSKERGNGAMQSHLRLNFFPLRLKYHKSQICDLSRLMLFRNKRVSSCPFAASFAKVNK